MPKDTIDMLKPCPFCGSGDSHIIGSGGNIKRECLDCGATCKEVKQENHNFNWEETEFALNTEWNTRAIDMLEGGVDVVDLKKDIFEMLRLSNEEITLFEVAQVVNILTSHIAENFHLIKKEK